MAIITFQNKDNTQPTSDARRLVRDVDLNEIKAVVNANAAAMAVAESFVYNEVPAGAVNGSNMNYTIANTPTSGTVIASADGVSLREGVDFNVSGTNFTMTWAPGQWLVINQYRK